MRMVTGHETEFYKYGGSLKNLTCPKNMVFPPDPKVFLDCGSPIIIESDVTFGSGVRVYTHTHEFTKSDWRKRPSVKTKSIPLVFKEGCFIGVYVVILYPCKYIGKYSVIGAGSIVTVERIPDHTIWAGNPAKQIGVVEK